MPSVKQFKKTCTSLAEPYGRGAGYAWQFGDGLNLDDAWRRCLADNSQGCEQCILIVYPKCAEGYHAVGCNICSPDCPADMTDLGVSCEKPMYDRTPYAHKAHC